LNINKIANNIYNIKSIIYKNNKNKTEFYENKKYIFLFYNFTLFFLINFLFYFSFKNVIDIKYILLFTLISLFINIFISEVLLDNPSNHSIEKNFYKKNKNDSDNFLLEKYRSSFYFISEKKKKLINDFLNSSNDFEKLFLEEYIEKECEINKDFLYYYCLNFINDNNKETLKENEDSLFLIIDSLLEYEQLELIEKYMKKANNLKFNSIIVDQAKSMSEKIIIKEPNQHHLIKQI
jgi:hypothetical protein